MNHDGMIMTGRVELSTDVNTFLASLPNLGDVLDVQYSTEVLDTNRVSLIVVVCYVYV